MAISCAECGLELAPNLLACPTCHSLVHAAQLKTLAAEAENATAAGALSDALVKWRAALELLPAGSGQHAAVQKKIDELGRRADAQSPVAQKKPKWGNAGGAFGVIGLLLWKFKVLILLVLSKAKLLLFGLSKASTLISMLVSFGIYWAEWGWKFALGFVLSIYVHEMGHVAMLRRYGIAATAPMFIPGLGAFIRLKQYPTNPHQEGMVGLAGPVWGLGATIAAYLIFALTNAPIFAAITKFSALVNLFNLLPIFQLDGGHAFRALSKWERAAIAAVALGAWGLSHEGLLLLIGGVAVFRVFQKDAPTERDSVVLSQFIFLIFGLTLLSRVPVLLADVAR